MNVHGQVREFSSWSVSPVQLGHNDVLGLACAGSRWEIYVDRKIPETYAIIRHKFITALSLLNSDFVLTFKCETAGQLNCVFDENLASVKLIKRLKLNVKAVFCLQTCNLQKVSKPVLYIYVFY